MRNDWSIGGDTGENSAHFQEVSQQISQRMCLLRYALTCACASVCDRERTAKVVDLF